MCDYQRDEFAILEVRFSPPRHFGKRFLSSDQNHNDGVANLSPQKLVFVLRQTIGNFVIVTFFGGKDVLG